MKKKGPRAVPDFSRKPKQVSHPGAPEPKAQPAPHPSAAVSKPQPPPKAGRRGA